MSQNFIENIFKRRNETKNSIIENSKDTTDKPRPEEDRHTHLYNLNRLKREKLKLQTEIKAKTNEISELKECTFAPKTTPLPQFIHQTERIKQNRMSNNNKQIFDRQKEWETNKQLKLETLRSRKIESESKECNFKPKLLNNDTQVCFQEASSEIVVDPESYRLYIKRQQKAIKDKQYSFTSNIVKESKSRLTDKERAMLEKSSKLDKNIESNSEIKLNLEVNFYINL